ncbi:MAG: diguanylate cyclase [Candidatus Omnitrophica bacterium]|nr:diguanylate cyclase [Candidatus Omnitrophota bacterium]HOX53962.1 diguanylate cyclase [Candidatus Omnitrophota bacterium]
MTEIDKIKQELDRARAEMSMLYEISNAMRTTLKLDEVLYIILTAVTAHAGLGFNRAMLFLINEKENIIEGKMGIGPDTGEEANRIWRNIEDQKMDFDDLTNAYRASGKMIDSEFNRIVRRIKFNLSDTENLLTMAAKDGMPLHVNQDTIERYNHDPLLKILNTNELAIVPLKAKDKINGVILADNKFTGKPITNEDLRIFIMLSNQAGLAIENSHLYEQTVILSNTDALTGLWNHGYFQLMLQEEIDRSKALNMPLSLMLIDIDHFKNYNDHLGHQKGDYILTEISKLLLGYSRKMDYVCRYGGEEFAVILPQTNKDGAYLIAERLRELIDQHKFAEEQIQPTNKLTVSIGLSCFPTDAATKSELILAADKALYEAKNSGRNKTCKTP